MYPGMDDGGYGGGPPDSYGEGGGRRQPDGYGVGEENSVLIIYGLSAEKVNCDKLFNLFCQYGNVVRVRCRNELKKVEQINVFFFFFFLFF